METEILKYILLSIVLGFLIGLERNIAFNQENEKGFAGSRTFALISLSGFLSAYLNTLIPHILIFSLIIIGLLVNIAYFLKVFHYSKQGSTTNIAALLTFLIGVSVYYKLIDLAIITTVIVVVILNLKTKLKKIETALTQKEVNAAILLLIMSFILLPVLPNKMIGPYELFNPYKTWMMAIIIASLSFLGYLAIKFFGEKKGILFTAAAGGFISSTAVTASLSAMFKQTLTNINTYISAIAIANTLMFARVLIESYITNKKLLNFLLIPYLSATLVGILVSYYLYKKSVTSKNISASIKNLEKNPLELNEAIKFALLFGLIYALVEYANRHYGNAGMMIVSFISGFTDVDAITLSLSEMSLKTLALKDAAFGILAASFSNTIVKYSIVVIAQKELAKKMFLFFGVEILFLTIGLGYFYIN